MSAPLPAWLAHGDEQPPPEVGEEFKPSALELQRRAYVPDVPEFLLKGGFALKQGAATTCVANEDGIREKFPSTFGQRDVEVVPGPAAAIAPVRVGCVLSGGQAAGGHSCIVALFDFLTARAPGSQVLGFIGGPKGVMTGEHRILDAEYVDLHRNTGGFTMLASGRDKIETEADLACAVETAKRERLDGLVVIGGDDSNTNAAVLAEHFKASGLSTCVVGLPKTIDGDLKNEHCETSFGFDTAAKLYAELVGNIMTDCQSTQKYYHFIRLMGREASHLTLEVALLTHPTLCFVGEEVKAKGLTLGAITTLICDTVAAREAAGLTYGVVLIPEGLVDFVPEVGALIREINDILAWPKYSDAGSSSYCGVTPEAVEEDLSDEAEATWAMLPSAFQAQLLLDRDPHGNVQVAKIESERLISELVAFELERRRREGSYKGPFAPQTHYFGYEGRCPPPSSFDCDYCAALGLTAGALLASRCTGYMACVKGVAGPASGWRPRGVPLTAMMSLEKRKGKLKPVIAKALVELGGAPFAALARQRDAWRTSAVFRVPGPVQFAGATASAVTLTLLHEQGRANEGAAAAAAEGASSALADARKAYAPRLPAVLSGGAPLRYVVGGTPTSAADEVFVRSQLPTTYGAPRIEITTSDAAASPQSSSPLEPKAGMRLGVVFCGRQCPGAHNVVAGLRAFLGTRCGADARLFGFVGGTHGLFRGDAREIDDALAASAVNLGGMWLLGRTADVIRTDEQRKQAALACAKYALDGLVLIGGPVTNSDVAVLAEAFKATSVATAVVGVPASIDGDMAGGAVETAVGFDTASRVYASLVANLATDAASARKYCALIRGLEPPRPTLPFPCPSPDLTARAIESRLCRVLCAADGALAVAHGARVRPPRAAERGARGRRARGAPRDAPGHCRRARGRRRRARGRRQELWRRARPGGAD